MSEKNPTTNESSTKKRRPQSQPQKIAAQALPRQGFLPRLGVNTTHILNPTATLARPGVIVQPAMSVNAPDDQYEVEANRVADAVMRMPTGPISDGWGKKAPTPAKRHLTPAFLQHSGGTSVSHAPLPRLKSAILEENDIVPPAMSVNTPDDHYEVEANRYADAVMRMPTGPIGGGWGKKAPTPAKRHLTPAFLEENDSGSPSVSHAPLPRLNYTFGRQNDSVARSVSHAPLPRLNYTFGRQNDSGSPSVSHAPLPRLNYTFGRQNDSVARAADDAPPAVTPEIENRIGQMDGGGEALPNETRGFFEERMGADFSGVRVHTDGNAAETSQAISARAFTTGNNIAFNKGEYNPGTSEGKHLLAHELTHTIQQGAAGSLARKVDEGETEERSPVEAATVEGAENSPDFIAVTEEVGQIAEKQKEHEEAETKADEAAAAAEMPLIEKQGLAENEQAQEIESAATVAQAKDAGFDKEAFKAAIKVKIEAITPSEPEELENIESNGLMGQVKEALTGQIDEGKDSAQGEVDDKIEQEPDPSSVAEKEVTPLSPNDPGSAPRSIDGAKAAPKAKEESDVEEPLAENVKSLDEQMAEAELTDEQLIAANEPEFLAAVESKKEYQTHAQSAPVEYRAAETGLLSTSQTEAGELTQSETLSMFEGRGQVFGDLDGLQTESKGSDEAKRQEIGQAINQIYQSTKTDVQAILDNLESLVDSAFNQGATKAQQAATAYIKTETQAYKDARYKTDETIDTSGGFMDTLGSVVEAGSEALSGAGNWVADTIVGMPDEYHQIYNVGRDKYIAEMDLVLDDVAKLVGDELGNAKKRIAQGRKEIEEYVAKQPDDLKQIALDAAQNIQGEFDTLEETVDSKADSLVNSLAEKYNENLAELDSQLDTLKEADKGLLEQATDNLSGVIQTINSLRDMLMGVLNSAAEVVTTIIADPIGFLSNLIDGVGQGLQNFVGNIGTHLQTGLSTWLFGEVAKAGIQMPETLDMKGLLELGTQVLGLTWDFIRNRAAKLLGDDVVSQLEETFDLFLIIKEQGMGGLWEEIQEQVGDLKETIIGSIGEMVASEVIEAGIQWLIGILGGPAGAFIKAAKAIYDLVMWFVDNGSQMVELVQAVINSVSAIADGAVGQAAQYVEESLAKAIPVTIGFLASLLGLGDLSSKIKGIIEQAQEPITRAIDWVIGKAKAFAQTMKSKLGLGKDKDGVVKLDDGEIGETQTFSDGEETHRLWIEIEGEEPVLMIASTPQKFRKFIESKEVSSLDDTEGHVANVQILQAQIIKNAKAVVKALSENNNLNSEKQDREAEQYDEETEKLLQTVVPSLKWILQRVNNKGTIIRAAVEGIGIVEFMKAMARKDEVMGVRNSDFQKIYNSNKETKAYCKGKFRSIHSGQHEWLPTNLIDEIIQIAHDAETFLEGVKWIDLHATLRSPTSHVILDPQRGEWRKVKQKIGRLEKTYYIPRGHTSSIHNDDPNIVGLVWDGKNGRYGLKKGKNTGMVGKASGRGKFHTGLVKIFTKNKTDINAYIEALRAYVSEWVWNGSEPEYQVHPAVLYHDAPAGGQSTARFANIQAIQYIEIMEAIDNAQPKGD